MIIKISGKYRVFKGLSIDTTHTPPPPLPLDSTFKSEKSQNYSLEPQQIELS
jgi:hypothetical protein